MPRFPRQTGHAAGEAPQPRPAPLPAAPHLLALKCHPSSTPLPATPCGGAAPSTAPGAGAWRGQSSASAEGAPRARGQAAEGCARTARSLPPGRPAPPRPSRATPLGPASGSGWGWPLQPPHFLEREGLLSLPVTSARPRVLRLPSHPGPATSPEPGSSSVDPLPFPPAGTSSHRFFPSCRVQDIFCTLASFT